MSWVPRMSWAPMSWAPSAPDVLGPVLFFKKESLKVVLEVVPGGRAPEGWVVDLQFARTVSFLSRLALEAPQE